MPVTGVQTCALPIFIETPGLIWGYNKTCSFALMRFDTTAADPTVTFEAITMDGEKVHSHQLKLSQLTHK
jgi:hypothetical protein